MYPTDCAIPDSCADSSTVFVRSTKNIIARLNVVPAPTPVMIRNGMIIQCSGIRKMPISPTDHIRPLVIPSIFCPANLYAMTGAMNVVGSIPS